MVFGWWTAMHRQNNMIQAAELPTPPGLDRNCFYISGRFLKRSYIFTKIKITA
jgi:hypothetical protein